MKEHDRESMEQSGEQLSSVTAARHVCWLPDLEKVNGACCVVDPGPDPTYDPDEIPTDAMVE